MGPSPLRISQEVDFNHCAATADSWRTYIPNFSKIRL